MSNLKSWSKGQSGNPKGYKKGIPNRSTIIKRWLEVSEYAENPISGEFEYLTQEELITLALIQKARCGNVHAYKSLMDSAYGKPQNYIEQIVSEVPLFPDFNVEVLDGSGNVIEVIENKAIK